jgi:FkbM family methyltransferase
MMEVLDFSASGSHRYRRHDVTLAFPGAPEDDSIAAYTHWHAPAPGELVFDIGAHAGFTTCMFARIVGPSGHVVAFEPDASSLAFLKMNIADQQISNVTIVRKAIDVKTGTAYFNADGTMGAGLIEHSVYGSTGQRTAVETLSFEDACSQFGIPQFVKMDIEGAEIAVIQSAAEFLEKHPMHLAFDSCHRMRDGRFTWMLLEPMLRTLGYEVRSSADFGQMFTWAKPKLPGH